MRYLTRSVCESSIVKGLDRTRWLFEDEAKYLKVLSFYHLIISDPYQRPSNTLSDGHLRIMLSPECAIKHFLNHKTVVYHT